MRSVLILTYYLHPDPNAGARRVDAIVQHLPACGWEPSVVTYPSAGLAERKARTFHTRHPGRLVRRGWAGASKDGSGTNRGDSDGRGVPEWLRGPGQRASALLIPDRHVAWVPFLVESGLAAVREVNPDVIFSSGPPHSVHVAAAIIARLTGKPWVAELRDPWSGYHYRGSGAINAAQRRLERRVLGRAAALVAVAPAQGEAIAAVNDREVYALVSGYSVAEREQLSALVLETREPSLHLVHAGSLYGGKRDPELVFEALRTLIDDGAVLAERVRFDFYGPKEQQVELLAARHGLEHMVTQHGSQPREVVLRAEREADVNLLLTWMVPDDQGVIPSKVFEYLCAGRFVMATGVPGQAVGPLLEATRAGALVSDAASAARVLRGWLAHPRDAQGRMAPAVDEAAMAGLTHEGMVRRLARVLQEVC